MIGFNMFEPTPIQIRNAELGDKDRCCRCFHPLSECPYFEDNGEGMTTEQKNRICAENCGSTR